MSIPDSKSLLRQRAQKWLISQKPEVLAKNSSKICDKIRETEEYHQSKTILLYSPIKYEPDVLPLFTESIKLKKRVCLPRYNSLSATYEFADILFGREIKMRKGQYGILEPCPENSRILLKSLDFCVVPGLMFGCDGTRLGRGKGHYDRILDAFSGFKIGVCHQGQIMSTVPVNQFDVPVDIICTELNVFRKSG